MAEHRANKKKNTRNINVTERIQHRPYKILNEGFMYASLSHLQSQSTYG